MPQGGNCQRIGSAWNKDLPTTGHCQMSKLESARGTKLMETNICLRPRGIRDQELLDTVAVTAGRLPGRLSQGPEA
ncbi:hypothetical protein J6590_036225 [Homalodisca vitripennis]|nr:hypothetical protein J6590_036225 [Homalodisca vitripennis]